MAEDASLLVYWINEREKIRKLKEQGGPPPWSSDPVFRSTYFCNVRREDDKVTRWIAEHWREGKAEHPAFPMAMTIARMFNLPIHLGVLNPYIFTLEENKARSKKIREDGFRTFNGAYLITTCGVKMDKIDYVYRVAADVDRYDYSYDSLESVHKQLTMINGLGSFLAAQIIADMKNTIGHPLSTAVDWHDWCAPGPGSLRGIKCVEGFEATSEGRFLPAAHQLYAAIRPALDVGNIHMQDFQNCLCEFSKYVKVKNGGRSKRNYNGH